MELTMKKYKLVTCIFGLMSSLFASCIAADTFFEVGVIAGQRQIDVFRKRAPQIEDDAHYAGAIVGAYRTVSLLPNGQPKAAWGGVIEVLNPLNRESNLPGNGQILGFRPVNYLRYWGKSVSTEFYFGAAQYRWIKHASGYYLGANARFALGETSRFAIMADYKYFQDLIHDGGPGGDQVIDGPSVGLGLIYRF